MQPLISVIMPVHNGGFTLDRAVRSVVAQEFADWEVVAVDDGSTDDTWKILQRWAAAADRLRRGRTGTIYFALLSGCVGVGPELYTLRC